MQYHKQLNKHDPENNQYGDCIRTCVACLLDLTPHQVPNFFVFNDVEANWINLEKWLNARGMSKCIIPIDGSPEPKQVMEMYAFDNYDVYYILMGKDKENNNHAVICLNGKIEHDPSWLELGIKGPTDSNAYFVMFLLPGFMKAKV